MLYSWLLTRGPVYVDDVDDVGRASWSPQTSAVQQLALVRSQTWAGDESETFRVTKTKDRLVRSPVPGGSVGGGDTSLRTVS